jgi:hypothetical protein
MGPKAFDLVDTQRGDIIKNDERQSLSEALGRGRSKRGPAL